MTKSKKFVSRMMFALVILTLVSFCFVGFTFARYTTGGEMDAKATVALWKITATEHTDSATNTINFEKLSPAMEEYADTIRTNSTSVAVLTIKNESDVNANVTLELPAFNDIADANYVIEIPDGLKKPGTEDAVDNAYVIELAKKHITIEYYTDAGLTQAFDASKPKTLHAQNADGEYKVFAKLVWTSDVGSTTGAAADAEDTILGQCLKSFSYKIAYTAVQASELPNA